MLRFLETFQQGFVELSVDHRWYMLRISGLHNRCNKEKIRWLQWCFSD